MVNKYYYIQRRGVTLKSNRSRSLKMGPIDRSYSRACVTIMSAHLLLSANLGYTNGIIIIIIIIIIIWGVFC